ncbi:MAG: glycosyltransferase family 25 protein [Halomonas sp.]|nr:glycosyltransferase family 25 protein [Halomonas sp.]
MIHQLAVDAVFCISLSEQQDRRELLKNEFRELGHEIEFILVERDAKNPERGCYRSHQICAQTALKRGYKRVLILEDDATFLNPENRQVARINRFLRWRNPQLFYLGGMLGRMWLTPWRNIVRCRLTGTQAYIISRKGCEVLVSHDYTGVAVDSFFCRAFKAYGTYPMLSQQQPDVEGESAIAEYRKETHGQKYIKDKDFWDANFRGQKKNLRKHWMRTLLMRF